jgi:four helix bundle protein
MFLRLAHTRLDIFIVSRNLVSAIYRSIKSFPSDERYALTQQIRRAVVSVHLNVAEGCSRKSSSERRRFLEIARGSLIEVDTALSLAVELEYISTECLREEEELINRCFQMLSKMIDLST